MESKSKSKEKYCFEREKGVAFLKLRMRQYLFFFSKHAFFPILIWNVTILNNIKGKQQIIKNRTAHKILFLTA